MSTSNNGDVKGPRTGHSAAAKMGRIAPSKSKPQNVSIDDVMWRVRQEVSRRSSQTQTAVFTNTADIRSFYESLPKWKSAVLRPPRKDEYALSELLPFSDEDFIEV